MGYSQPRGSGRRPLDSAELAVVIGGGALFMIGLVAVVLVVALRGRSTPAPSLAMAPAQAQPASAPSQSLPKVVSPSVSAPPPPAPSAAPAAKSSASPVKLPDEAPVEQDQDDDDEIEDGPQTIDLQAPWSQGPGVDDRAGSDHGNESVSARLARQAQERARAAREERQRREEERRRREEQQAAAAASSSTPAVGPSPLPTAPDPYGRRFGQGYVPPQHTLVDPSREPEYVRPAPAPQSEYVVNWRGRQVPARTFGFMACFVGLCSLGYAGFATNASGGKRTGEFIFGTIAVGFGLICIIAPAILAR